MSEELTSPYNRCLSQEPCEIQNPHTLYSYSADILMLQQVVTVLAVVTDTKHLVP